MVSATRSFSPVEPTGRACLALHSDAQCSGCSDVGAGLKVPFHFPEVGLVGSSEIQGARN